MTISFHALWMLCALGTVVHAATAARRVRDVTALAIGFVIATVAASPQRLPDPAWVGVFSSVNRHGVGCAEHTCGNPRLEQYMMEQGSRAGVPVLAT